MKCQHVGSDPHVLNEMPNLADAPGGCPNIKMSSYQYRDPHNKDKTVSWPSYL